MEMTFRPIVVWPGTATASRKRASFRSTYTDTLTLLDRELRQLKAKAIVLQMALQERDIRLDGKPCGDVRPAHPGVILSFESSHGPLSYPCDTYDRWEHNLHAIALALECLRAVDRYGVSGRGEQYRGWTALPAPPPKMDRAGAIRFLQKYVTETIDSADKAKEAYRLASMRTHPDRGGDPEEFKKVQQAKEALEL